MYPAQVQARGIALKYRINWKGLKGRDVRMELEVKEVWMGMRETCGGAEGPG